MKQKLYKELVLCQVYSTLTYCTRKSRTWQHNFYKMSSQQLCCYSSVQYINVSILESSPGTNHWYCDRVSSSQKKKKNKRLCLMVHLQLEHQGFSRSDIPETCHRLHWCPWPPKRYVVLGTSFLLWFCWAPGSWVSPFLSLFCVAIMQNTIALFF